MKLLYSKEAKNKLEKIKSNNKIVLLCLSFAMIVLFILSLILASYKTRLPFYIVSSIILGALGIVLTFFVARFVHIKNLVYDFEYIENAESNVINGKVVSISNDLVTLPDKLKVYEVRVEFNDGSGKVLSISEMFEPVLKVGSNYKIEVVSNYIKGFEEL